MPVLANKLNLLVLVDKWSNKVTFGLPQEAMVQLRSWMIPAEACLGTFVALKGACGKTTTTKHSSNTLLHLVSFFTERTLHKDRIL